MAGVEHTSTSAPVPSVDSEPADTELSGTAMLDTMGNMSHGSPDQPALLRHGTQTTQKQLPWKYQNFALLADTNPSGICGLVCVFVSISYHVCTLFLWEV